MYRFINFLLLARVSFSFLKIYVAYRRLNKKKGYLFQFWNQSQQQIKSLGDLETPLQRRIFHYLFANNLTTQWFCTLLNYEPTPKERETGYYIAMATPIADYLVDHEKLAVSEIHQMIDHDSTHPLQSLTQQLFQHTMDRHPFPEIGRRLIYLTLEAQQESLQQHQDDLSTQKLKNITWAKGGYALLLYRSALNRPISQQEWDAVYQLGGLMQLHNDIFDLHRDLREGIITLPTQTTSVKDLSKLYSDEIEKTFALYHQQPFSSYQKRKFFLLLYLAVQTGHQCLKQYANVEAKYGEFNPIKLSRQELVCDMEDLGKISETVLATLNKKYP